MAGDRAGGDSVGQFKFAADDVWQAEEGATLGPVVGINVGGVFLLGVVRVYLFLIVTRTHRDDETVLP